MSQAKSRWKVVITPTGESRIEVIDQGGAHCDAVARVGIGGGVVKDRKYKDGGDCEPAKNIIDLNVR